MIKTRLIPTLLYKDLGLVKGEAFDSWRRIGGVVQSIRVYNLREVDELVFLDISATGEGRPPDFEAIDEYADNCFMPLTVGGGIRTVEDVRKLLAAGADKVAINTAAVKTPEIIRDTARVFGAQCVVVSIDARARPGGGHEVFINSGALATGLDPVEHARMAESMGAGELLVTSIDHDGLLAGYDIKLIKAVSDAVSIPVIASGGAGKPQDFVDAIQQGHATAVAAAAIFHFTETTPSEVKAYMKQAGINMRI
jgi:cyclase